MASLSKHRLTPMVKGFFLGKFMPPHNGHLYVCDVARRFVDEFTVLVCSHDAEPIDGHLRAQWMRDCVDGWGCNLIHMHRNIPQEPKDHPDFWTIWKDTIFELHPDPIDYVFGSEAYVHQLAQVLNAKPFIVDQPRQVVPVSGTAIRKNAGQNWDHIPAAVRPAFQKRVTLIGPESTGKSTLTGLLGDHFNTKTIPEFGRDYDATFKQGKNWNDADFLKIAKGHRAQASAIATHAGPIVVEDTDVLQTVVWSEALLGTAPQALIDELNAAPKPDLYLLLNPEMEWIDDGTRYHQSIEDRHWFHARLKHWLVKVGASWHDVTGATWNTRQDCATQLISTAFD